MRYFQLFLSVILILCVILDIICYFYKNKMKKITINDEMQNYYENIIKQDDIQIKEGKVSSFNFNTKELVINNLNITTMYEYLILLHEYGHYKDYLKKPKDILNLTQFIKIVTLFLSVAIVILLGGKLLFNLNDKLLTFILIIQIVLFIIDMILTLDLEYQANKSAMDILNRLDKFNLSEDRKLYIYTMCSQMLDRFLILQLFIVMYLFCIIKS